MKKTKKRLYCRRKHTRRKISRRGIKREGKRGGGGKEILFTKEEVLKMEYPYYRYTYRWNKEEFMKLYHSYSARIDWTNSRSLKGIFPCDLGSINKGKYVIIQTSYFDPVEWKINKLSDYFSESVRIKCIFKVFGKTKQLSPLEYWQTYKEKIVNQTIRGMKYAMNGGAIIKLNDLHETMYGEIKLCNNFRITVASAVIHLFSPKSWLDISAGWGDRLITALLNGVKYEATDPNLDLHPCYNEMISTIGGNSNMYKVHPTGFLEAEIEGTDFDIVFSSPPFFDLEIYSTHAGDSMVTNGSSLEQWIDGFLMPAIEKAYNKLRIGGHMILYIGNHGPYGNKALEKWDIIMKKLGVIYFYDSVARGMHVWQKK